MSREQPEAPSMMVRACILALGLFASPLFAVAQQVANVPSPAKAERLPLDQVLTRLEESNAQRAAALQQFEGTRVYRMEYRGFPGNRDAEMVVKVRFLAPSSKEFTVVSETGSKFVIDRVFKKLLEGEQEASNRENRRNTALSRQNYDFELAGFESTPTGGEYVVKLLPKTKNKFLYRGKVWIDAKDFAVVRIEGEPGKNPSMWIKKTDIAHTYKKVGNFWLPAENHTESFIRLGGKATLSIQYRDYRIIKASPTGKAKALGAPSDVNVQSITGADASIFVGHIAIPGSR